MTAASSAVSPACAPKTPWARFLEQFLESRGLNQSRVAKEMRNLEKDSALMPVDGSTLSRWIKGKVQRCPGRESFNAVILAALRAEWKASGSTGRRPGLGDVDEMWDLWRVWKQGGSGGSGVTSGAAEAGPAADPSDAERVAISRTYGGAGAALLDEVRESSPNALLDLGLLRLLDGDEREGEAWLRQARELGSIQAGGLVGEVDPKQRRAAAIQCALAREAALHEAAPSCERSVLLLECAARAGSPEAAERLVVHFGRRGDVGAAARWRAAARTGNQDPH